MAVQLWLILFEVKGEESAACDEQGRERNV